MALPWPLLAAGISFLPKPGAWMNHVKHVFGFLIILIGIYYAVQAWDLYFTEHASEQNKTEDALTAAVERSRKSGKPVLIDFYADWCKNCVVMEQTTFRNKEVKEALKKFEFVRFDATDTSSPAVQTVLNKYQIKGLPAFVILEPEK
jgi:thiol:disulfide interchange protein